MTERLRLKAIKRPPRPAPALAPGESAPSMPERMPERERSES
jgi:hypothetical protein